jgi:hypothetical protein
MYSTAMNIRSLQKAQHAHDLRAHQDVVSFPAQRQLTHFALHFSKYVGSCLKAKRNGDVNAMKRLVTDTFIISLAAANTLSMELEDVPAISSSDAPSHLDSIDLILRFAEATGEMAKACESWDHGEKFPIQDVLERSVQKIAVLSMQLAAVEHVDLEAAVLDRWEAIERKVNGSLSKGGRREHVAA